MTFTAYDLTRLKRHIGLLRHEFHKTRLTKDIRVDPNALYDAIKALEQVTDELERRKYSL